MDDDLIRNLRSCLTPDLVRKEYRGEHPMAGHCYVATEVLYRLLGGQPMKVQHEGVLHYFLIYTVEGNDFVVDATADQFKTPVPWDQGKKTKFKPKISERASIVLDRMT